MIWANLSTAEAAAAWAYGRLACTCADACREPAGAGIDVTRAIFQRAQGEALAACILAGATNGLRVSLGLPVETFLAVLAGPLAAATAEAVFAQLADADVQIARRELGDVEILLCRVAHAGRPA